ncbi:MAG: hypothetical protein WKF75_14615, partial [Singulisphaera sp.]
MGTPWACRTSTTGPRRATRTEGVGNFCLMAGGSYGGDGLHADTPANMSAWCKYFLGWAPVQTVTSNMTLAFEPVQEGNAIYRIFVPGTGEKEYFLIEFRKKDWKSLFDDDGRVNWDEHLSSTGLAIWHVDERVGADSPSWPFTASDMGQNDKPVKIVGTPPRFAADRPLVALIQADGDMHLDRGANRGDEGDLWDARIAFADDPKCQRGSRGYNGKPTGIKISDIDFTHMLAQVVLNDPPAENDRPADLVADTGGPAPSEARTRRSASSRPQGARDAVAAPSSREKGRALAATSPHSKEQQADYLRRLDLKVDQGGTQALTEEDYEWLQDIPPRLIRAVVKPRNVPTIVAHAAKARTEEITPGSAPMTPAAGEIQKLVAQSTRTKEATVRYAPVADPGEQRIERMTKLSIPAFEGSPEKDATMRIKSDLKPLLGEGVQVIPMEVPEADGGRRRFVQVFPYKGEDLPVYGREVTLFYDKQDLLTAVTNSTIPPEQFHVTGGADDLTPEQARKLVSDRLGVSEKVLTSQP